jgi:tetratricopeptide (TPR) repeat protein
MTDDQQIEKDLQDTLGNEDVHLLRSALKQVDAQWQSSDHDSHVPSAIVQPIASRAKVRRLPLNRILAIAASIVVLLVAGIWLIGGEDDPATLESLYTEYGAPYRTTLTARGTNLTTLEQAAFLAYDQQQYGEAFRLFLDLLKERPQEHFYTFYAGSSALAAGRPLEAVPFFQQLIEQSDHLLVEQSQWYLAMSYLKAADTDISQLTKAVKLLEKFQPHHYKYAEAKALLVEIQSLNL